MILVSARTTHRAIAVLALVTTQLAGQAKPFVPQIERTQLADGVFHFKAGPDGYVASTNMVVVVNDRDVPVFDTSTRPATARAALPGATRSEGSGLRPRDGDGEG